MSPVAGHCISIDGDWWHEPGQCPGAIENCNGRCCSMQDRPGTYCLVHSMALPCPIVCLVHIEHEPCQACAADITVRL